MEHPCHNCGSSVEEGTAFCRHCGAPQIRVATPAAEPASPPLEPGTPGELQPPARPVDLDPNAPARSGAQLPPALLWSHALPSALSAGVLLAVCWILPPLMFFFWLLAGGAIAVVLYRRRVPGSTITPALGSRIGALAGLAGFAIFAALFSGQMFFAGGTFRAMVEEKLKQQVNSGDQATQELMQRMLTPEGMAVMVTMVLVVFLVLFVLLGSAGGALSGYLGQPRKRE